MNAIAPLRPRADDHPRVVALHATGDAGRLRGVRADAGPASAAGISARECFVNYEFIDYSAVYYRLIAGRPLPPRRGGKFVQLVNEDLDRSCLVIAPADMASFHAQIVERFCLLGKISGSRTSRNDCYEIDDPEWRVIGGGKWSVDDVEKTVIFFDKSRMYGPFDPAEVRNALLSAGALGGYLVTLREP